MSPYRIPACAGKPYRPSNGSEGMMFMEAFCDRCERDRRFRETGEDSCPIIRASLIFGADDESYPHALVHTADGEPTCLAFTPEGKP